MTHPPVLPFWVALFFGAGSLLCYLTLAAFVRISRDAQEDAGSDDFNLGLPDGQDYYRLFGTSVAAAGTPLSTVVAFFLTSGSAFGARLFLCPLFFAAGMYILYCVYNRARNNGYFNTGPSRGRFSEIGLIPYLGVRLTGSKKIGWMLLVICALPLLGLLTLEIAFGIQIVEYLTAGAFHAAYTEWRAFVVFAVFVIFLLGYVFVGGFRAVLRSDVWQYKLVQTGVVLSIATFVILAIQNPVSLHWKVLWPATRASDLVSFYVPVIFVNLILPLGLVSSWQRFHAFERATPNVRSAIFCSLKKTVALWSGLITVGLASVVLALGNGGNSLSAFFDWLQAQGDWCRFFLFPVLVVAALSAMYSCSDTCVSALLYLNEYGQNEAAIARVKTFNPLPRRYYWSMGLILGVTLMTYWFLRIRFSGDITAAPLFKLAVALYANLSVVAPTILLTALIPASANQAQLRVDLSPAIRAALNMIS